MTSLAGRRRRNTLFALAAGLVAAVAAPTLVYVGANAITNSKAGKNALAYAPLEFNNGGSLRDYQAEGVRWMLANWRRERNSILADEVRV